MKYFGFVHFLNLGLIGVIGYLIYLTMNYYNEVKNLNDYLNENNFYPLILTAYNSHRNQTDEQPHITASGSKTSYQTLALSQDFIRNYNRPGCKGLNYGDTVTVVISKKIIIEDTMNSRYSDRGDIWVDDLKEAKQFGKQEGLLIAGKRFTVKVQGNN